MEKEISLLPGDNLDSVVYTLLAAKERGERVFCVFNGHKLHSDTVSIDSAYEEVVGCTKAEHEQKIKAEYERLKEEQEIAKQQAIECIPSWIKRGQALIFPEREKEWVKCVTTRAMDIYHGYDLESALEIMEALDKGVSIEEAIKMLYNQNHSGMSASIVRSIVLSFSKQGPEFFEATVVGEITPEKKQQIEKQKQENRRLVEEAKTNGRHI